jgi:hypothetical protein
MTEEAKSRINNKSIQMNHGLLGTTIEQDEG